MGMLSMTRSAAPLPKLRVTLSCSEPAPPCAHCRSAEVGSDDDKLAAEADFDDDFRDRAVERDAGDDALDFAGFDIALAVRDLPSEDEVFEIEDREVVIFKLSRFGSRRMATCSLAGLLLVPRVLRSALTVAATPPPAVTTALLQSTLDVLACTTSCRSVTVYLIVNGARAGAGRLGALRHRGASADRP